MFYDIPHLYVEVKGEEGMGADDFLVLTKGQFSLYDISSDSLKVEPWIQTKHFQLSEGFCLLWSPLMVTAVQII